MKKLIFLILLTANLLSAQTTTNNNQKEKKGLSFGIGLGAGTLALNTHETTSLNFSASLPNIKLGYALSDKFSLMLYLAGSTYKFEDLDRGFEGILFSGQYWIKNRWWINAGLGLTFDAPAFYTVKDFASANFYTGFPATSFSTGYEVFKKANFVIDIQYRIFLGKSGLENNIERAGVSNMFIVGFNFY